jgi:hypothetical protein
MFKCPLWATAIAVAVGLQPAAAAAQQIETAFALPSQTQTIATPYVAHDAGFLKKEGVKVTDRYLVGFASPNAQKVSLVGRLLDARGRADELRRPLLRRTLHLKIVNRVELAQSVQLNL